MTEMYKLTIKNFDSMENLESNAEHVSEETYFHDDENENAYCKCNKYLTKLKYSPYLGHNLKVYPIFDVSRVHIK